MVFVQGPAVEYICSDKGAAGHGFSVAWFRWRGASMLALAPWDKSRSTAPATFSISGCIWVVAGILLILFGETLTGSVLMRDLFGDTR